ncbi:hypothetical protein ACFLUD_04585, partial [Chloroflexota bacterium]
VLTPAIAITPTAGPRGTSVNVTGTNFPVGGTGIVVTWDGVAKITLITADTSGAWGPRTFTVPTTALAGSHIVDAYSAVTPATQVADVTFTVQAAQNLDTGVYYPTIQAAITAATAGDTIKVFAGTHTEAIIVSKQLTIKSEGAATTIVDATGLDEATVRITAAGTIFGLMENGQAKGLTITGADADCGIYVNANSVEISGNIITANDRGIGISSTASGALVYHNDILSNTSGDGIYNEGTNSADARYNWWGDISGPGGIGPGSGDTITTYVAYEPWLTKVSATVVDSGFAYVGYELSLGEGWNIFSTPFALDASADTWGELKTLGNGLSVHATSPIYYYDPIAAVGYRWKQVTSTTKISPLKAYYVRMASADEAPVLLNPLGFTSEAAVYGGWNLISLSSLPDEASSMHASEALVDILYAADGYSQGYIRVASPPDCNQPAAWWYYGGPPTGGDEGWLHVGHGYWVYMRNSAYLGAHVIYPVLLPMP